MTQSHLSAQFDAELGAIANRVLWMGGPVESQVVSAVHALTTFNGEDASEVLQDEERVDEMEVEVDRKSQATTASGGERATDSRAHLGFEREPDASLSALLGRALADATALSAVRHSLVASGDADFEVAASETGLFMLHALGEARGAVGWGGAAHRPRAILTQSLQWRLLAQALPS